MDLRFGLLLANTLSTDTNKSSDASVVIAPWVGTIASLVIIVLGVVASVFVKKHWPWLRARFEERSKWRFWALYAPAVLFALVSVFVDRDSLGQICSGTCNPFVAIGITVVFVVFILSQVIGFIYSDKINEDFLAQRSALEATKKKAATMVGIADLFLKVVGHKANRVRGAVRTGKIRPRVISDILSPARQVAAIVQTIHSLISLRLNDGESLRISLFGRDPSGHMQPFFGWDGIDATERILEMWENEKSRFHMSSVPPKSTLVVEVAKSGKMREIKDTVAAAAATDDHFCIFSGQSPDNTRTIIGIPLRSANDRKADVTYVLMMASSQVDAFRGGLMGKEEFEGCIEHATVRLTYELDVLNLFTAAFRKNKDADNSNEAGSLEEASEGYPGNSRKHIEESAN